MTSLSASTPLAELVATLGADVEPSADEILAAFEPDYVSSGGGSALVQELLSYRVAIRMSRELREDDAVILHLPDGLLEVTGSLGESGLLRDVNISRTGPLTGIGWAQLLQREPAVSGSSTLPPSVAAALDTLVDDAREIQRLPGLLAAVADRRGTLLWTRQLGVATIDLTAPPTADTVLRIASITKTMTATLVLQLVEEGRVGLDDEANQHLVAFQLGGPLTVRQLLTHTSGLGNRPGAPIACAPGEEPALADFYGPVLVGQAPPSPQFVYSNDAFGVLGQLVEDVVGIPFSEHAEKSLFAPLGMTRTGFHQPAGPIFQGIDLIGGELAAVPFQAITVPPAGSAFSTLNDLALYGAAVHGLGANRHGQVLSRKTFAQLIEPQRHVTGLPAGATMCHGWLRFDLGGTDLIWHNGGWPGAKSELGVLPAIGYTVLLFANTLKSDLDSLCMQVATTLLNGAA